VQATGFDVVDSFDDGVDVNGTSGIGRSLRTVKEGDVLGLRYRDKVNSRGALVVELTCELLIFRHQLFAGEEHLSQFCLAIFFHDNGSFLRTFTGFQGMTVRDRILKLKRSSQTETGGRNKSECTCRCGVVAQGHKTREVLCLSKYL